MLLLPGASSRRRATNTSGGVHLDAFATVRTRRVPVETVNPSTPANFRAAPSAVALVRRMQINPELDQLQHGILFGHHTLRANEPKHGTDARGIIAVPALSGSVLGVAEGTGYGRKSA